MAERKAVNKYYPPDWDPTKGSVNKHVGQHPLRERAKKLSQGILVIRFEMPYNIWCGGCGNHIGMGVRYNAEKKKVGNYYTTPIYRFRMKCHLCDNYIEMETDPKNCEYTIVTGARRKEERWDPVAAENVIATDHAEKQKLIDDAMFKLEHGEKDKRKSKAAIPGLVQIKDMQTQWKDDFGLNQMLRKKFRQEKKVILQKEEKDQEIKDKGGLDLDLVNEVPEDIKLAKKIRFHTGSYEEDKRKRRLQIKSRPIFSETSEKTINRFHLLEKRQKMMLPGARTTIFTRNSEDFGIRRKSNEKKECSKTETLQDLDRTTCASLDVDYESKINLENTTNPGECRNKESSGLQTNHQIPEGSILDRASIPRLSKDEKPMKCGTMLTASPDVGSEDGCHSKITSSKISLVSDVYSDTDSDGSK